MKTFLRKIVLFFVPLVIVSGAAVVLFVHSVTSHTSSYELPKHITQIYVGDSHIQASVVDSLLPNAMNLGNSSENFYYTFYKLKSILAVNPQLQEVYLGSGFHSISSYYDTYTFGEKSHLVSPTYFFFLPYSEKLKQTAFGLKNITSYIKKIHKTGKKLKANNTSEVMGGFRNLFETSEAQDSSMIKRLNLQFYKENKDLKAFSQINIDYVKRIVQLCKEKNVNLSILNTPLHQFYYSRVPEEYIDKYYELMKSESLNLIDFSFLKLGANGYYPDGDHISLKGAELMTKKLLLDKNN